MEFIVKAKPPEENAKNSTSIGETERSLKIGFLEHKPSSTSSEVSKQFILNL